MWILNYFQIDLEIMCNMYRVFLCKILSSDINFDFSGDAIYSSVFVVDFFFNVCK